jgi:hypothetical protein
MDKINDGPTKPVQISQLVANFITLRNHMEKLKKEYLETVKPCEDLKDKLTARILAFLDGSDQESARTAEGTVTKGVKHDASLDDPDMFMAFVREHDKYELLDRKANTKACMEYVKENGSLPPGVKINSIRKLSVTKPRSSTPFTPEV